jgi:hypothetical protein
MKLPLDDNLRKEGINDISLIGNDLVILANITKKNERIEKRFEVRILNNSTQEDVIDSLEEKLDKHLGRLPCECVIRFISKPENWNKIVEKLESNNTEDKKENKKKITIKKYTAKGTMPLHESVVINKVPKFVYLDKDKKPHFVDSIERTNDILIPGDTFDTQNPIPFIFESEQEFEEYLERSKSETLDTLFDKFECQNRKYVDTEDHYHTLLTADMIWTWLQDLFAYNHEVVITGDNGSGKNSELLTFKFLAYRTFYTVSASASNYWTKMGNIEECQITIAEDEADDIAKDRDKRNVVKNGYSSGGSVPKVELEGGRKSEDWLVYCFKIFAMEEIPDDKDMKGILDRSFVLRFVAGSPKYNIKNLLKPKVDPKFQPLYDDLIGLRNTMLCWRLSHYNDIIVDVDLNVKNRSAELTSPLIRLFQDSPVALGKILYSLSQFMKERNEIKATSFESILYEVIEELVKTREVELAKDNPIPELVTLGKTTFTNEDIRNLAKSKMDGEDSFDKPNSFLSPMEGIGEVTQQRITSTCKSRFKAKPTFVRLPDPKDPDKEKTHRALIFDKRDLKRVKSNYQGVNEIKIEKPVTPITPITDFRGVADTKIEKIDKNNEGNSTEIDNNIVEKWGSKPPESVTPVTSVINDKLEGKNQDV